MKKIFGLIIVLAGFWVAPAFAQTEEESVDGGQTISRVEEKDKGDKKKIKTEMRGNSNVYSPEAAKPASPYAANTEVGGFTVRKFKESKTTKKLRRGEARSRMSVPTPKGKPLKHKKKRKFAFFG